MGWKAPVKVQWTREDDMRAGRYRPAFIHKMRAALDDNGNLVALRDTLVGQSIGKDSFMEKGLVRTEWTAVGGGHGQPALCHSKSARRPNYNNFSGIRALVAIGWIDAYSVCP